MLVCFPMVLFPVEINVINTLKLVLFYSISFYNYVCLGVRQSSGMSLAERANSFKYKNSGLDDHSE